MLFLLALKIMPIRKYKSLWKKKQNLNICSKYTSKKMFQMQIVWSFLKDKPLLISPLILRARCQVTVESLSPLQKLFCLL